MFIGMLQKFALWTVNDVPGKYPLKHPQGGFTGGLRGVSKESFTWKDPSDPCKPSLSKGLFPGTSLTVHSVCLF